MPTNDLGHDITKSAIALQIIKSSRNGKLERHLNNNRLANEPALLQMASVRALHVVCLFTFLLSAWRIDCQTTCSEHLGATKLPNFQTPLQGKLSVRFSLYILKSREISFFIDETVRFVCMFCPTGKEPQVCVSNMTCCTDQTEDTLRVKAAKKMKTLIDTKYTAAKSSLLSLLDELKGKCLSTVR